MTIRVVRYIIYVLFINFIPCFLRRKEKKRKAKNQIQGTNFCLDILSEQKRFKRTLHMAPMSLSSSGGDSGGTKHHRRWSPPPRLLSPTAVGVRCRGSGMEQGRRWLGFLPPSLSLSVEHFIDSEECMGWRAVAFLRPRYGRIRCLATRICRLRARPGRWWSGGASGIGRGHGGWSI